MQQMLDWREGEIQNEISLLDNAETSFTGSNMPCSSVMHKHVEDPC